MNVAIKSLLFLFLTILVTDATFEEPKAAIKQYSDCDAELDCDRSYSYCDYYDHTCQSFPGYVTYKPNSYCGGPTIQAGWLGTLQEAIDNCKHGPFNCGCVVDWEGDGRKYWRMEGTSTLPDPSSGSCAWVMP